MKFNSKHRPCCNILEGLDIVQGCDNCGTVVVEKDVGKHTIKVIDSCEANKAKAAIKEILLQVGEASDCVIDVDPDRLLRLLKKYGFERAK